MTDRKRLTAKLTKLATEAAVIEEGWIQISADTPGTPLLGFITLIDEIIFPVTVNLRNSSGDELDMLAGNRRLRCILGPMPDALTGFKALCDLELGDWNTGAQDQIPDLLRAHIGDSPEIWVRIGEPPTSASVGGGGLSANKLAEICGMPPLSSADVDAGVAFDAFADDLRAKSDGWLRLVDEDVVEREGLDDLEIDTLNGIFQLTSKTQPNVTASSDRRPVLVLMSTKDDSQIVLAQSGATSFVARVSLGVAADLAASWRSSGL